MTQKRKKYHVFLSHNSVDKPWVNRLKDALEQRRLKVWLDQYEIRPGDLFVDALEKGLESSRAVALIVSPEAMQSGWVKEEYNRAVTLAQNKKEPLRLIPVILRLAELPGFLSGRNWVDFTDEASFNEAVEKLIWGITGKRPHNAPSLPITQKKPVESIEISEVPTGITPTQLSEFVPVYPIQSEELATVNVPSPHQDHSEHVPENTAMNEQQSNPQRPLKLFLSYTRKDRHWLERLKEYLTILIQQRYLQTWDDSQIQPGDLWAETINMNLLNSDIVLFLITSDFMGSDYAFSVEMRTVLRRLKENKVAAIPVILSPANWKNSPLVDLKPLPSNGQPLSEWANPEDGFLDIVEGIRDICQKLITQQPSIITRTSSLSENLKFNEVFLKSGTPDYTFVEYADFKRLKFAIAEPGRGVVIEGPSGIGKTTAVKKALEEIVSSSQTRLSNTSVHVLSARSPQQVKQIQALQDWHQGTLVIDDFHRLNETMRQHVVDYLKYLADTEAESKKLVIVGIPYTRHRLVQLSFDLATRIDVFSLSRVSDYDIQTMIEKGEKALHIRFDQKAEIVRAANGSLNLAQYICNTICSMEEIVETQVQQRWVSCDIKTVVASVMADLSTKFDETLHKFARLGGQRNSIALRLLEELARCEDGFLSLSVLKNQRPDLALGIDRFINEKWIDNLYQEYPVSKYQLFFDQIGTALVADDPQLIFYLNKTRFSQLAKETGKVASLAQCKVFISYSHQDNQWLSRLQVHLKPLEQQEGIIDLWADTKITAGMIWKEKVQEALDVARVALVLVSADFLASDFVIKHELPKLLSNASSSGTIIIPIILSPCLFGKSKLASFQSVNSPDSPLSSLDYHAQELVLMHVAEVVSDYLENGEA